MICIIFWRLNPPTITEFVINLSSILSNIVARPDIANNFDNVVEMEIVFTKLNLWDRYFIDFKASTLNFASSLNTVESLDIT